MRIEDAGEVPTPCEARRRCSIRISFFYFYFFCCVIITGCIAWRDWLACGVCLLPGFRDGVPTLGIGAAGAGGGWGFYLFIISIIINICFWGNSTHVCSAVNSE